MRGAKNDRTKSKPEKIGDRVEGQPLEGYPDSDPSLSPDLDQLDSWEDVERDWPGMYEAQPGENVQVELIRLWPETWRDSSNQEVQCGGYCGTIPPGWTCLYEYISRFHGGGKYLIRVRQNGIFGPQRKVRVSGPPQFSTVASNSQPVPSPAAINSPPPAAAIPPEPGSPEAFNNVSLAGSDAEFERRIVRIMSLKALLEKPAQVQPPDINGILLQHILNAQAPPATTTDQLKDFIEVAATLREITPAEQASGGDWIEKLIGLVTTLISKSMPIPGTGANLPVRRSPAIALTQNQPLAIRPAENGPGGGKIAAEPAAEAAGIPLSATHKMEETQEMAKPTFQQLGATAVQIVTNGYLVPGGTPPIEVARNLDLLIPPDADTSLVSKMVPWRNQIFGLVKNQIVDVLETEDDVKKFRDWFDEVFDLFIDPERERATWG